MNRESLLKATLFASQAVATRSSAPILECLHLRTHPEHPILSVTGSNGDFHAKSEMEISTQDAVFDLCVPAARFKTVLSQIPDDEVTLEESGDSLMIRGANARGGRVMTQSAEHYPELPPLKGKRVVLPGAALEQMLCAASTDQNRSLMQSVFLSRDGFLYASDGHRIHRSKCEKFPMDAILPIEVAKHLAGETGEIIVAEKSFMATGDGWEMGGKLIEGQYPTGATKAIPAKSNLEIAVTEDFTKALQRTAACLTGIRKVIIEPGLIWCGPSDQRDWEDPVDVDLGEVVAINPDYLLDAIKAAGEGAKITAIEDNCLKIEAAGFCAAIFRMRV